MWVVMDLASASLPVANPEGPRSAASLAALRRDPRISRPPARKGTRPPEKCTSRDLARAFLNQIARRDLRWVPLTSTSCAKRAIWCRHGGERPLGPHPLVKAKPSRLPANNTKTKLRNALKEAWPHADAASVPFEEAVAI